MQKLAKELTRKFYYNTDVDYRFKIEENESNNLQFKLYDKSNTFIFNSEYDEYNKYYYFRKSGFIYRL